jgi:hypothetical protein
MELELLVYLQELLVIIRFGRHSMCDQVLFTNFVECCQTEGRRSRERAASSCCEKQIQFKAVSCDRINIKRHEIDVQHTDRTFLGDRVFARQVDTLDANLAQLSCSRADSALFDVPYAWCRLIHIASFSFA